MLTVTGGGSLTRALSTSIDPSMKRLLIERRDQLGGDIRGQARFLIAEASDGLDALETELSFPVRGYLEGSFGCEWVADHGTFYEAVWILTDDGYAHVALISKRDVDPELRRFCELHVTDPV